MKKIPLSEVDGTVPGRAALVSIDLENPDTRDGFMQTVYVEGEGRCDDPHLWAEGLRESIKGDWPTHTFTIILNERARYLMAARRMREMGLGEYPVQDYLEA